MTVCKARHGKHQFHYAAFRFPQVLCPCLLRQSCACSWKWAHREQPLNSSPSFWEASANLPCTGSKTQSRSAGCWESCPECVPWECQKSETEISVPYIKHSKAQVISGWLPLLSMGGTGWTQAKWETPAALSCSMASIKTTSHQQTQTFTKRDTTCCCYCGASPKQTMCPVFGIALGFSSQQNSKSKSWEHTQTLQILIMSTGAPYW